LEAYFSGVAFAAHRHDTYAIGITLGGVQSFSYRGASRNSEAGRCFILHPDELHDGHAGTHDGFHYRVAYVDPLAIQNVLGGTALPFIEDGVSSDPRLHRAVLALLGELDRELCELEYQDAIYDLAIALQQASGSSHQNHKCYDYVSAETAREYISSHLDQTISLDVLEQITGRDRWKLSRDFRALFGTSPYRYLIMRRLDAVRGLMLSGSSPSSAAFDTHFSDQSHMNRHFKKTYGLTPKQWLGTMHRDRPTLN
jgi:AraC-like DNA-binding protein